MIKELQIRPFARPLLVWMAGIVLQTVFPVGAYSIVLLLLPFSVLLVSFLLSKRQGRFCYETRWLWGAVFVCLLLFLSIQKTVYSQIALDSERTESSLLTFAHEEQLRLLEPFNKLKLTDEEKSVLATITVGYREAMDRNVRKRFSATGVAHLLAVSGFHVAIVCGFLSFLLSILPRNEPFRWIRYVVTVTLLWSFVAITGLAASAVRAALMLTLYLTGRLLGRLAERYNILAASAFCMLVYEPLYLFDIGFQLSYLAVFSILYFQPRLQQLMKVRNPILRAPWEGITVTLSAQVGTTFLCLYYFGQFSTVFLLTNLPLTFLATLLIPAGLVWMLLPEGCPGYGLLQAGVEWLTRGLLRIVDDFSEVQGAVFSFRFDLLTMLAAYGILLFGLLYVRSKRPPYLFAALSVVLIMLIVRLIGNLKQCGI